MTSRLVLAILALVLFLGPSGCSSSEQRRPDDSGSTAVTPRPRPSLADTMLEEAELMQLQLLFNSKLDGLAALVNYFRFIPPARNKAEQELMESSFTARLNKLLGKTQE